MDKNPMHKEETFWEGPPLQVFSGPGIPVTPEMQLEPRYGRPIRSAQIGDQPNETNGHLSGLLRWDDSVAAAVSRAVDANLSGPEAEAVKRAVATVIEEAILKLRTGQ